MLGSLRVRLPLIFLAGIVLAGVITTAISIRLFQQFTAEPDPFEAEPRGERDRRALFEGGERGLRQQEPRPEGADVRRQDVGEGDGRPYLPARPAARPLPGTDHGLASVAAGADRLAHREVGHVRVHAARAAPSVPGRGQPDRIVRHHDRCDRRRDAEDRHPPTGQLTDRPAGDRRGLRLARRGAARVVSVAADRAADPAALGCRRRSRERELRRQGAAERAGRARSSELARRRDGAPARHGRADGAELPDVRLARVAHSADSDPRSRRGAARGRDRRSGAQTELTRNGGGGDAAARAAGRRHPRPREARHEPVHGHDGRGRHGGADRAGVRALSRRGSAALDRLPAAARRAAGDHLGRRPRAAGRRQPALERVPRDARRRAHHAGACSAERHRARGGRGHRAGDPRRGARAAVPPVRLERQRRHRPRTCDREGAVDCARRADRPRVRRRRGLAVRAAPARGRA